MNSRVGSFWPNSSHNGKQQNEPGVSAIIQYSEKNH